MIYYVAITLGILVAINFLLLRFSCNKTTKKVSKTSKFTTINKPVIRLSEAKKLPTKKSASGQLAATAS